MKKIIDNNFDDITNTNIDIEDDIYDPPFSNLSDIEPPSVSRLTVPVDHMDVGSEQGSALLNFDNIKSGNLYRLGDHRLLCGDSTNDNDISKLLDGKITD